MESSGGVLRREKGGILSGERLLYFDGRRENVGNPIACLDFISEGRNLRKKKDSPLLEREIYSRKTSSF